MPSPCPHPQHWPNRPRGCQGSGGDVHRRRRPRAAERSGEHAGELRRKVGCATQKRIVRQGTEIVKPAGGGRRVR
eukprot:190119-Chlamydomonas_euryale.AAC.1